MASINISSVVQRTYTNEAVVYGSISADDAADANTLNSVRYRTATSGWITATVDTTDSDYLFPATGSGAFRLPVTLPVGHTTHLTFSLSISSAAVGPFGGHETLGNNLVCCYECDDDAASSTVTDTHTTGNDGTLLLDSAGWAPRNTEDEAIVGHLDSAFWCTQQGVNITTAVDFTAVEGGSQGSVYHLGRSFSWSMWIRWPSNTGVGANSRATYDAVLSNWIGAGNYLAIMWKDVGGGDWRLQFVTLSGSFRGVQTNTDLSAHDDTWFHVVCTYDHDQGSANQEDRQKIYINGADDTGKLGTAGDPGGMDSSAWFYGGRPDANYPGRCDMDQFCSWSRDLTSAEALYLYNGGSGIRYSD